MPAAKSATAKPRLDPNRRRVQQLNMRCTTLELQILDGAFALTGLASKNEWLVGLVVREAKILAAQANNAELLKDLAELEQESPPWRSGGASSRLTDKEFNRIQAERERAGMEPATIRRRIHEPKPAPASGPDFFETHTRIPFFKNPDYYTFAQSPAHATSPEEPPPVKRGRGRPRKNG